MVACVLVLSACTTGAAEPEAETPATSAVPSASEAPATEEPEPEEPEPEEPEDTATPRSRPVSLPALFEREYDGRGLRLRGVTARTDAYTSHTVTYRSGDLTISGKLNVPNGRGPFPALVLAHGYIDPAYYVNGQGLMREQDWLARAGYVVLHTDYRNHAGSSNDPRAERRMRLGYTVDTINAVMHREGDTICILASTMPAHELLALARAKASRPRRRCAAGQQPPRRRSRPGRGGRIDPRRRQVVSGLMHRRSHGARAGRLRSSAKLACHHQT